MKIEVKKEEPKKEENGGADVTPTPVKPRDDETPIPNPEVAIPIAVFCATFILARAFLGMQTATQQGWVITMALIGSLASLFVLASLAVFVLLLLDMIFKPGA